MHFRPMRMEHSVTFAHIFVRCWAVKTELHVLLLAGYQYAEMMSSLTSVCLSAVGAWWLNKWSYWRQLVPRALLIPWRQLVLRVMLIPPQHHTRPCTVLRIWSALMQGTGVNPTPTPTLMSHLAVTLRDLAVTPCGHVCVASRASLYKCWTLLSVTSRLSLWFARTRLAVIVYSHCLPLCTPISVTVWVLGVVE